MDRVTGIGGAFFKAKEPAKLKDWYVSRLGLEFINSSAIFEWAIQIQTTAKGIRFLPFSPAFQSILIPARSRLWSTSA